MEVVPVRFGVELEFVGPGIKYCRHLLEKKLEIPRPSRRAGVEPTSTWTLAVDLSVFNDNREHEYVHEDRFAMELRTPIMTEDQLSQMSKVLKLFKPVCFITRSCGMHVHLSTPQQGVLLDYNGMAKWLWKRYGRTVWHHRRRYCKKGTTDEDEDSGYDPEKYRVVNVVDPGQNHIEYRIFNGSLDYKYVADRVRASIDCFRTFMKVGDLNGYGQPYPEPVSKKRKAKVVSVPCEATVEEAPLPWGASATGRRLVIEERRPTRTRRVPQYDGYE